MLVLALMDHILNKIFIMKYETHAYGIKNVCKKWNEKKKTEIHFENWF